MARQARSRASIPADEVMCEGKLTMAARVGTAMDRRSLILAALAAGGENTSYSPVQVQKLLFLIDEEAAGLVHGPHFRFEPYNYGPFDWAVYEQIDALAREDLIEIHESDRYPTYVLTSEGYHRGAGELHGLSEPAQSFLTKVARWIKPLSFQQIVAAIYKRYPEMKSNSVFCG